MPTCEMSGKVVDAKDLITVTIEGVEMRVMKEFAKFGTVKQTQPSMRARSRSFRTQVEWRVKNGFSSLIRRTREEKQMSQKDFAAFLGEREAIVAKWESGSLRPQVDDARRIGKKLGVFLIEKDDDGSKEASTSTHKKSSPASELTLGDMIKVRKRHG